MFCGSKFWYEGNLFSVTYWWEMTGLKWKEKKDWKNGVIQLDILLYLEAGSYRWTIQDSGIAIEKP